MLARGTKSNAQSAQSTPCLLSEQAGGVFSHKQTSEGKSNPPTMPTEPASCQGALNIKKVNPNAAPSQTPPFVPLCRSCHSSIPDRPRAWSSACLSSAHARSPFIISHPMPSPCILLRSRVNPAMDSRLVSRAMNSGFGLPCAQPSQQLGVLEQVHIQSLLQPSPS